MNLFILDPNLAHPHGHHMEWDFAIAAVVREREQHVTIFANKECSLREVDGVEVVPWFSHSCYETRFPDPVSGRFDDFKYYNDRLAEDLRLLPQERFRATDAVLVPTVTERHLLGYVSWMKSFDPARAPLFIVYLMFPSGLGAMGPSGFTVADPLRALFYKLAFRRAEEPGTRIEFFGGGRQLAREFSGLLSAPIEPHPIPNKLIRQGHAPGSRQRSAALLFAGDAKVEKGFGLLPALAETLCTEYPDWDFLIHANIGASWGETLDAYNDLMQIASEHHNLRVCEGRLTRAEYAALMEEADCLISTYDPVVYARKSSGVVWEAISLAMPMLVPAGTWLESEAREWSAGYAAYTEWSAEGIASAFPDFAASVALLYPPSAVAAERYHAFNGAEALVNQFGRLWVARMMAASMATQPAKITLQLDRMAGQGWSYPETLDGRTVRWVDKTFDIAFAWPFDAGWRAEIEVSGFIAAEQVTGARANLNEIALPVDAIVTGEKNGRITVDGPGPGTDTPQLRLRVELPWTYRPESETRDLGILVSSVVIKPAETAGRKSALQTAIGVLTKVQRADDGRSFLLDGAVSGFAVFDPRTGGSIQFDIAAETPPGARGVQLFVNGCPLRLTVIADGAGFWHAAADCPPDILSRHGYRAEWDLVLDRSLSEHPVWIANLSAHDARDSHTAHQGAVTQQESFPTTAGAPATRSDQAVSQEDTTFESASLNQHFVNPGGYAHLDLSVTGVSRGGAVWAEIRFKFCLDNGRRRFEFRDLPGWPNVLDFQDAQSDQFGRFLCIGDGDPPPHRSTPRERAVIAALIRLLPEAVEIALRAGSFDHYEVARWVREAEAASSEWGPEIFGAAQTRLMA